ncbi:hypothetical protein EUA60_03045 [TM7 phylum sp. oral taxon 346]|nr:hypothetical protein EUA60_03045 [TM7 phylum sp. oral taxon 346]
MNKELLGIFVSGAFSFIAVVVSIFGYRNSKKTSQVSSELLIQQMISNARKDVHDLSFRLNGDDKKIGKSLLNALLEQELNVYNTACASYLDRKIDRKRFKKTYLIEIQNFFEKDSEIKKIIEKTGRYNALKKVYEEWFNLEK